MKRLVPETVQTTRIDCGPAALKSLLAGHDIHVNYGRLRELCQTSIDGTSIDALERVANELGLAADQVILPRDHVLLPVTESLPAIALTQLPNGSIHFIVVWSVANGQVQVMDPRLGRIWLSEAQFLEQLFVHEVTMDGAAWRDWAGTEGFIAPLRSRLADAGAVALLDEMVESAEANDWLPLASLDAATRMVAQLVVANVIAAGTEASALIGELTAAVQTNPDDALTHIPAPYWFARAANGDDVTVRGAVLLSALGTSAAAASDPSPNHQTLTQPDPHPLRAIWQLLREDGLLAPTVIALAAALAALGVTLEAVVLRGILDIGAELTIRSQRVTVFSLFISFAILMLLLELLLSESVQRMGRHLDTRLRVAFLSKIPRLGDQFFQSRPISDMTMRVHELALVRQLPALGVRLLRLCFQLLLTTIGVAILIPQMLGVVLGVLIVAIAPSIIMQSQLREQDLRLRSHSGGLSRFYLDGLLGLVMLRAHSAEIPYQNSHDMRLTEWVRAARGYSRAALAMQGMQAAVGTLCAIWIVLRYLAIGADPSGLLLLFYWVLNLPQLGQQFATAALQYPQLHNRFLRIAEPLNAPILERDQLGRQISDRAGRAPSGGVSIEMQNVSVERNGTRILHEIDLQIGAGEQIAIVGASGAGKSTLVGLLLGWHTATSGTVSVDNAPLDLARLRQETAWVDPAVQLWNELLIDNLLYGNSAEYQNSVLNHADLYDVVQGLPDGMQTRLGEAGGLLSGGEGQRVRLGRAMMRPDARLVILDEPFRGLDRDQRHTLLARVRAYWPHATLLFISHDLHETQQFERVLVLENGRLIEDDDPQMLAAHPASHYARLLNAEAALRHDLWANDRWQRWHLKNGALSQSIS